MKLGPEGKVKVLDFGLAKALDVEASSMSASELAHSPTITYGATVAGVILGTAAYMAPEQAKGRPVDRRADSWAFGVVLWECLTGKRLFAGEDAPDTLARVLTAEPDFTALPATTPWALHELLRHCLVRDVRHRLQAIGDARVVLEDLAAGTGEGAPLAPSTVAGAAATGKAASRQRLFARLALAGLGLSAVLGAALLWPSSPASSPPSIRAAIPLPEGLSLDGVGPPVLAMSPDGRTLAFLARRETGPQSLYVRRIEEAEAVLVPGSETAEGPFFSPDGRWVGFAVGVSLIAASPPELRKYSLETGLTQKICDLDDFFGATWSAGDEILFVNAPPTPLSKVAASGGEPTPLGPFQVGGDELEADVAWPELLPGGRHLVLTDWWAYGTGELVAVDLESRELISLGLRGSAARYLPTGHLVYAGEHASLMAVPFDARTLEVLGSPVALMPEIALGRGGVPAFAFSRDGTLVFATGYLPFSRREPLRLVRKERSGEAAPLSFAPDLFLRGAAVSPDGGRLVATTWDGSRWVFDLARGTRAKLPGELSTWGYRIVWTPDGQRMAFSAVLPGQTSLAIFAQNVDGAGEPEVLVEALPGREQYAAGWTPEGALVFWRSGGPGDLDTLLARIRPGSAEEVIWNEGGGVAAADVSPDGRWVAFDSDASGDFQIYATPSAGGGRRLAVTAGGGRYPVWSRDGRELYYRRDRAFFAVAVAPHGSGLEFGPEEHLFDWDSTREFSVGPDGSFFGTERVPGAAEQRLLQLRTGWFAEVERLAGGGP